MKLSSILMHAGIAAVVAGFLIVASHPVSPPSAALEATMAPHTNNSLRDVAHLEAELERVQARLGDLEARPVTSTPTGGHDTRAAVTAAEREGSLRIPLDNFQPQQTETTGESGDLIQQLERERARFQQISMFLEDSLAAQTQDAHWSNFAVESTMAALTTPTLAATYLTDIRCQTTLCQMNVEHTDGEAEENFLNSFAGAVGLAETEAFYTREVQANGTVRMTYFFSRDGYSLPRMP